MFAKNSPFVGLFNQAIAKHTSFIERTYRKYFELQLRHCPSDSAGIGRVASSGPLSKLPVVLFLLLSVSAFSVPQRNSDGFSPILFGHDCRLKVYRFYLNTV